MINLDDIRKDLKNIKYYYSRKSLLDKAFASTCSNNVLDKVVLYNEAIKTADTLLYDVYYALYIRNHTQESYSEELGCTPEYVQRLNKKLLLFFQKSIKKEENLCL